MSHYIPPILNKRKHRKKPKIFPSRRAAKSYRGRGKVLRTLLILGNTYHRCYTTMYP